MTPTLNRRPDFLWSLHLLRVYLFFLTEPTLFHLFAVQNVPDSSTFIFKLNITCCCVLKDCSNHPFPSSIFWHNCRQRHARLLFISHDYDKIKEWLAWEANIGDYFWIQKFLSFKQRMELFRRFDVRDANCSFYKDSNYYLVTPRSLMWHRLTGQYFQYCDAGYYVCC